MRCSRLSRRSDRALDLPGPGAHGARHLQSWERSSLEDRAADALHRVDLELAPAVGLEALDRVDQAEDAALHQVGDVDVEGSPVLTRPATYLTSGA